MHDGSRSMDLLSCRAIKDKRAEKNKAAVHEKKREKKELVSSDFGICSFTGHEYGQEHRYLPEGV